MMYFAHLRVHIIPISCSYIGNFLMKFLAAECHF